MSDICKSQVVLIRGAPGSGKSTLAKRLFPNHIHLEADMFFTGPDGYSFDGSKIKDAHAWCLGQFERSVMSRQAVVVSNTFTRLWEIRPYVDFAPDAKIIRCLGRFDNIHGVPASVVERMRSNYEPMQNEETAK